MNDGYILEEHGKALAKRGNRLAGKALISIAAGWDHQKYQQHITTDTRIQFDQFTQRIAQLNNVSSIANTFAVDPSVQQTMERRMEQDERIVVLGEDVHQLGGGTNGATKGLAKRFGPKRVIGTRASRACSV